MAGDGFRCPQMSQEHVSGLAGIMFCCLSWLRAWGWQGGSPLGTQCGVRPGVAVAASPRSQGRSWRAGKTLDTPQISALTINKAESHIVLQENWFRNPLWKLGVGHSLTRIEFGLICHLAAMPPFLFEWQLLFHCMGLADHPMLSMCLTSDLKKMAPWFLFNYVKTLKILIVFLKVWKPRWAI